MSASGPSGPLVYCDIVTFQFGSLGQVWYLIVSIPDACCLSYFYIHVTDIGAHI